MPDPISTEMLAQQLESQAELVRGLGDRLDALIALLVEKRVIANGDVERRVQSKRMRY
jgi:hypothetical protein